MMTNAHQLVPANPYKSANRGKADTKYTDKILQDLHNCYYQEKKAFQA